MRENLTRLLMKFTILYNKKIIILLVCFLIINFVFSQEPIVKCKTAEECNWEAFGESLGRLINAIVIISFWLAFLLTTVGAFFIMFHGPSEALYRRGIDMIKIAIFGYILVLSSAIVFDIILDFFQPKFTKLNLINFAFAVDSNVTSWYEFLKRNVSASLKCGQNATSALDRLFKCAFEAIEVLKDVSLILLALAIIISAAYIISVPLFGLQNIPRAYQVLIWSIIGFIVVLLANLIKSQIERLVK